MPPEDYQDERYEWNLQKNDLNYAKHGVTFIEAIRIFDGYYRETLVLRPELTELRFLATGLIREKEYSVIYTRRKGRIRIITARRARNYEREAFWDSYGD